LNLTQAFNSLGTTIGPYLGGLLILGAVAENKDVLAKMSTQALHAFRVQQAATVKMPYVVIGLALLAFAVLIGLFKLPAIPEVERHSDGRHDGSLWKYRHLILGCVAIFVYVGAEVSIGSFLINYFKERESGTCRRLRVRGSWPITGAGRWWGVLSARLFSRKRKLESSWELRRSALAHWC